MGAERSKELGFDEWAQTLLSELEQQTPDAIRKLRSSERHEITVPVVIKPGNMSDSHKQSVHAVTGDVSSGGCQVMSNVPVLVGDVYKLNFEKGELDLPTVYARCLRCRLVREDAYECGFAFFNQIKLDEVTSVDPITDSLL